MFSEVNSDLFLFKACSICLAPGDSVNHVDHLAVVAYILGVPLVTEEELIVETIKKYYPQVKPVYIPNKAQILEFLAKNYDILFVSSANYRKELSPLLEVVFSKKMEFWYCPHGNSDKPLHQFALQDRSLIYGPQMKERLYQHCILSKLSKYVQTGNYRLLFYKQQEEFYDEIVDREVFSKFQKRQKIFFYAPTWQDLESSSSLFDIGKMVIDQLPSHYNLLVKLHPWTEHHHPGYVHLIREKYRNHPNVIILSLYPLIFPLLKRSDVYLGDFSSISYDFLYFNRPMFFFDPEDRLDRERKNSSFIHRCGVLVPKKNYTDLYSFIDQESQKDDRFKKIRGETYRYTFGEDKSFSSIRRNISEKVSLPRRGD